ncbi:MAG: hypothetical protein LBH20_08605 [Treponema sp.]|jgi:hypothetical protein|nr:hypothetical protein [Treponema sp.]
MFNAKWGLICGGAAFVLAFVISLLLGHTSLPVALVRAAGFAALFFGMGTGIWVLVNIFIPELLETRDNSSDDVFSGKSTGARVNITLDDMSDTALPGDMPAAVPDAGAGGADTDHVGDFNDLISLSINRDQDIDQNFATGYTEKEREEFTPVFDNSANNVKIEGLGDFSMDFGAFVPEGGKAEDTDPLTDPFSFMSGGTGDSSGFEETSAPQRKSSKSKTAQLDGDFNPKDIAAGIRTVLEKDKKG